MTITPEEKKELYAKYGSSESDTGNSEAQIAVFTKRISMLTEHLKKNRKDYNTQRSLIIMVGKRRKLLNYLKQIDIERYRAIIKDLGLRK